MLSRQHESELALARLGCRKSPCILIGGLGMRYTLRQALDMLGVDTRVVVGELVGDIIE